MYYQRAEQLYSQAIMYKPFKEQRLLLLRRYFISRLHNINDQTLNIICYFNMVSSMVMLSKFNYVMLTMTFT